MNQKLRFAFATVITLLAVLWISYCVFCGFIYLKGSSLGERVMWWAGALSALVFILLTASFIGVQLLKATDHKFKKFIVWERIFMFCICPIVFLFSGYYYSHFFTVHSLSKNAEDSFVNSVAKAKNIFPEYRRYAANRIDDYSYSLACNDYKKENKVHVLTNRILPPSLSQLETQCTTWIKDVDKKVTVWNPFLLGNIPYIKNGIEEWEDKLYEFSNFKMTDERDVVYFDEDRSYIQDVLSGLETTQLIYSEWRFPNFWAILTCLLCYALLVFAYVIQERNTKNLHTLFTNPRKSADDEFSHVEKKQIKKSGPIVGDF